MWRRSWPVPKRKSQMQSFAVRCIANWLRIWELGSEEKLKRMSWWASATDCLVEKRKLMNSGKKKKKASQMQALIFLGNCSHLNICWSVNRMGWKQSRRFWSVLPIIFDADAGQTVYGKVLLHMLLTSMEELVGGRCQGCWQPWLQKDHGVQDLERSEEGK